MDLFLKASSNFIIMTRETHPQQTLSISQNTLVHDIIKGLSHTLRGKYLHSTHRKEEETRQTQDSLTDTDIQKTDGETRRHI